MYLNVTHKISGCLERNITHILKQNNLFSSNEYEKMFGTSDKPVAIAEIIDAKSVIKLTTLFGRMVIGNLSETVVQSKKINNKKINSKKINFLGREETD
jgi:hypothetical protein